jgi:hypothetical protein
MSSIISFQAKLVNNNQVQSLNQSGDIQLNLFSGIDPAIGTYQFENDSLSIQIQSPSGSTIRYYAYASIVYQLQYKPLEAYVNGQKLDLIVVESKQNISQDLVKNTTQEIQNIECKNHSKNWKKQDMGKWYHWMIRLVSKKRRLPKSMTEFIVLVRTIVYQLGDMRMAETIRKKGGTEMVNMKSIEAQMFYQMQSKLIIDEFQSTYIRYRDNKGQRENDVSTIVQFQLLVTRICEACISEDFRLECKDMNCNELFSFCVFIAKHYSCRDNALASKVFQMALDLSPDRQLNNNLLSLCVIYLNYGYMTTLLRRSARAQ